jgi:AhpD family alkylhydroperoxidase
MEFAMSQRFNVRQAAPEGYKAFGPLYQYVESCGLGRRLVDLVFLRVSQINGCSYCVDKHWSDLVKDGEDQRKLNSVITWKEAPFFSARERAALAWADSLTNLPQTGAPDADYAAVTSEFSEKEVADLTIVIGLMNAMNRIGVGSRLAPALEAKAA